MFKKLFFAFFPLILLVKRLHKSTFFALNFSLIWVIPLILSWAYFDGITPFIIDYFANKSKTFLIELPFSRKMETEADEFGLKLASKACFDIRHAPLYWAKMNEMEQESEKEGENLHIPEFLSTHPRSQSFTSLMADLCQYRNRGFAFSRCLNGTFP